MFDSVILDVAVGVIFSFLTISLVSSAVLEAISSVLGWRAESLRDGVQQLVNDPDFKGLALQLYQHAAINPRGVLTSQTLSANPAAVDLRACPAYIEASQFATALMDILGLSNGGVQNTPPNTPTDALKAAVDLALQQNPQLKKLLTGIVERSKGDLGKIETALAAWFNNGMDRLSGAYKRRTQLVTFIVALGLAAVLNVDTIRIARVLWEQPALANKLIVPTEVAAKLAAQGGLESTTESTSTAPAASADKATSRNEAPQKQPIGNAEADRTLDVLTKYLPVGWSGESWPLEDDPMHWLLAVVGWLITAIATLFGAPFWFDTLQAVVRLKGTGPSPMDKRSKRAASA